MIFRSIDQDGDWNFGKGKNDYLQQNAAIGLNIKTRLLSWVNDCFFDLQAGIDWINRIGYRNQTGLLEVDLRRVILQSSGVTAMNSFSTILTERDFSASYDINTIYSKNYQQQIERGF